MKPYNERKMKNNLGAATGVTWNFDPRQPEYRGTATRLPSLLESISGEGL